jgi:hypothetical protein
MMPIWDVPINGSALICRAAKMLPAYLGLLPTFTVCHHYTAGDQRQNSRKYDEMLDL